VLFTGTTGTDIPAGSIISRTDGVQYSTNLDWQIGNSASLTFTAVVPGVNGNSVTGIALTLSSPIVGVTSPGVGTSAITGGANQETDDSLRGRMLAVYAAPPQGGAAHDYVNWALSVPGVSRAWVLSQTTTPGSVLIFIMLDQAESATNGFAVGSTGGATLETRTAPATGDQLAVANYIFPLQPVTSLVIVSTPTANPISFSIQSLSPANTTTEANISAALADMFIRLGAPLATNTLYPSDVNATIESASGVGRYTLLAPITPITTTDGFLPTLGSVVYS
jgi:uncharacterized phage protein gp47/JayE